MTRDEFSIIVKSMKAVYTDPKFLPDNHAFNVWYAILKDIPYKECADSLQAYMSTERFAPTPADLRKKRIEYRDVQTAEEAWTKVIKALRNSAYGSEQEFNRLDEVTQRAIGSPSALRQLAIDEHLNLEVEKSLFVREYNNEMKRSYEKAVLPGNLLERMTGGQKRLSENSSNIGTALPVNN